MRRAGAVLCGLIALVAAAAGLLALAGGARSQVPPHAVDPSELEPGERVRLMARGRRLFEEGCVSCHGLDARGLPGRAPSLWGAGAASADFYLSTGRMPLPYPEAEPLRGDPPYTALERQALVAYVASLGEGPPIPDVEPARGDVVRGRELFTYSCAGCHQIVGEGGVVTGAQVPPLDDVTPTQVGEAIRVGPYAMPWWDEEVISDAAVDDIAAYVRYSAELAPAPGGWPIGRVGPVPEGIVAFFIAGTALVLMARLAGRREA